jgi:hypothetical protein
MFEADQNNVVFVNFHKYEIGDFEIEQFGKRELFQKIIKKKKKNSRKIN